MKPDRDILDECAAAVSASKAWPCVFAPGAAMVVAVAVLTVLRRRGFLTLDGIVAVKAAEKAREAKP